MNTDPFNTTATEPRCCTCGQTTVGQSFWLNDLGPYCHACRVKVAAPPPSPPLPFIWNPANLPSPVPDLQEVIRGELEKALKPYLARAETIITAARALVAKLDAVSNSPEFTGVFQMAAIHGCPYKGPQFGPELEALRAALSDTNRQPALPSDTTSSNESPRSDL